MCSCLTADGRVGAINEGPPTDTKLGCHLLEPLSIKCIIDGHWHRHTAHGGVGDGPQTPTIQGQINIPSFEGFFYIFKNVALLRTKSDL